MSRLKKTDAEIEESPESMVQAFAASANFPKERAGVLALAQALKRASSDFGITMATIVKQCTDTSTWCPTPHELRGMAMSIRDAIRNRKAYSQHAEWERMYGAPDPDWSARMVNIAAGAGHEEQKTAGREFGIRCVLFYTEGDGCDFGDRDFWLEARHQALKDHPQLVAEIRSRGGWRTERELQQAHQPSPKPAQPQRPDIRKLASGDQS